MPFVPVKCASCGGDIQLDDQREFGFCVYCGSKVMYQETIQKIKVEHSGSIKINGVATDDSLVENGYMLLNKSTNGNQINEVIEKFKKALEINPKNQAAWNGIRDCSNTLVNWGYQSIDSNRSNSWSCFGQALEIDPNNFRVWEAKFEYELKREYGHGSYGVYYVSDTYEAYKGNDDDIRKKYCVKKDEGALDFINNAIQLCPETERNVLIEKREKNIDKKLYEMAVGRMNKLQEEDNKKHGFWRKFF